MNLRRALTTVLLVAAMAALVWAPVPVRYLLSALVGAGLLASLAWRASVGRDRWIEIFLAVVLGAPLSGMAWLTVERWFPIALALIGYAAAGRAGHLWRLASTPPLPESGRSRRSAAFEGTAHAIGEPTSPPGTSVPMVLWSKGWLSRSSSQARVELRGPTRRVGWIREACGS